MSGVSLVAPSASLYESWLDSRDEWGGVGVHQPGAGLGVANQLGLDLASRSGFEQWVQELLMQPGAEPSWGWWRP